MEGSETSTTPNERLEALKARYIPAPDNQHQLGDGDLNKIMDRYLYEATKIGDVEKFINTLEKVAESRNLALLLIFNRVTPSENSLLHVAASSGRNDVMELILNHFPYTVTKKNSSEDTPLHIAIQDRRFNATEKLIQLGTCSEVIYWKNKDGKSPLYLAVEKCTFRNSNIAMLLLQESTLDEAYAVKIQGKSPVLAAIEPWRPGLLEEIIDRLPKLLQARDENGGTPLHFAAAVGNSEAKKLLLEKCPYLALQTDKNGSYPIHIACERSWSGAWEPLLKDTWPDLAEIKNKKGQNILHVAAKAGNRRVVRHILDKCEEPDVIEKLVISKDVDGNTPLHLALMHNHLRVVSYLMKVKRSDSQLRNNESLATESLQMFYRYIEASVPRSNGRQSTGEPSSEESELSRFKQIKKELDTQLLVATLVASVSFTAGITLPGGYNVSNDPHPGMATLLHNRLFQVFIIFDTLATFASTLSVVVLLRAHNANLHVAEEVYDIAGPALLWAVFAMTVAFSAAVTLAVSKLTWLAILLLCFAVPYVGSLCIVYQCIPIMAIFAGETLQSSMDFL
ncbi:hypothetical protein BT93_A2304 [Corymbia citriodora subsp. variegata]|nr:hypothetical protein BT93_A2304 [Corymbia citriodora subsp. variegata]